MRLIFFITALIVTSVLAVTYKYKHHNSDPVPVVEPAVQQPEQLHYVIYLFVCGKLEGVLVVGDPRPRWVNDHEAASARMLQLMADSEKEGRAVNIRHWHRNCPEAKA